MSASYVKYSPELEPAIEDEEAKIDQLIEIVGRTQHHNFSMHRHYFRATHVKTQGIVKGTLIILPDLAPELAQGIASKENAAEPHPVAIRYANEPSWLNDDRKPGPRGCGMKIFNVHGDKFLDPVGEATHTQDLTFNNAPVLELRDLPTTLDIFRIREAHFREPDKIPDVIKQQRDDDVDLQLAPASLPNHHFVAYVMYSQSAYRWGDYVAKYALFPTGEMQQKLADSAQITDSSDAEQHSMWLREFFDRHDAEYDLRVQLLQDPNKQSVEDTGSEWPEDQFPFRTVGKIVIPKGQAPMEAERRAFWDDGMKLNPWHGLEAHRPVGSVNRLRKRLYQSSVERRQQGNARPIKAVKDIDEIP